MQHVRRSPADGERRALSPDLHQIRPFGQDSGARFRRPRAGKNQAGIHAIRLQYTLQQVLVGEFEGQYGVGNGVPPLLPQKVFERIVGGGFMKKYDATHREAMS